MPSFQDTWYSLKGQKREDCQGKNFYEFITFIFYYIKHYLWKCLVLFYSISWNTYVIDFYKIEKKDFTAKIFCDVAVYVYWNKCISYSNKIASFRRFRSIQNIILNGNW